MSAGIKMSPRSTSMTSKDTTLRNPYIQRKHTHQEDNPEDNPTDTSNSTQNWRGTPISPQQNQNLFTIGFSNVNGISTGSKRTLSTNLNDLTTTLDYYRISLFGMSEHHVPMNNPGIAESIHRFERSTRPTIPVKCMFHSSQEVTPDRRNRYHCITEHHRKDLP